MNQISNTNFSSIEQMTGQLLKSKNTGQNRVTDSNRVSFQEVLRQQQKLTETDRLRFSKHASERLESRNIDLTDNQLKRLETGAQKAKEKGINESLVMVDNIAFIVNTKNKTVITAVNDGEDKIFTNIDGAVII